MSSRRSRPHTHSGGRQTEGEDSGASPFHPPHRPPVISAAERAKKTGFWESLRGPSLLRPSKGRGGDLSQRNKPAPTDETPLERFGGQVHGGVAVQLIDKPTAWWLKKPSKAEFCSVTKAE
ncbi:hypothetical protein MHYP_G00192110 [Metynnis hypsauchen]